MDETVWHDTAGVNDLDGETGLAVTIRGESIALFRVGDAVYAVEDFCPHQGSPLSGALTRNGVITCPLHAWQFRLADGQNVNDGPGLRVYPVRIRDGRVEVRA